MPWRDREHEYDEPQTYGPIYPDEHYDYDGHWYSSAPTTAPLDVSAQENRELAEARAEIQRLREENEMLRNMAAPHHFGAHDFYDDPESWVLPDVGDR